jgi:peptidoglycan/LPS O-acetylase OafA/YrhL
MRYRPQLDGLRFCAVAAVVVEHNWDPPAAPWIFGRLDYAEFGVRLFFVLSGFLITGILIRGREMADATEGDRRSVLSNFYARRFLRIFPIYYLTLIVVVILGVGPAREAWPWLFAYGTNFYVWAHLHFLGPLGHLWTLAVEEQFYIVWPWLVLFLPRRYLLPVLVGLIAAAPLYRLYASFHYREDTLHNFASGTLTIGVLDSLALGSLLALLAPSISASPQRDRMLRRYLLVPGLIVWFAVMATAHYGFDEHAFITLGQTGEALVCGWLVVHAARGFRGFGRVLELRPIAYVGKISYGVYIFHLLVPVGLAAVATHLGYTYQGSGFGSFAPSAIVTIALAAASWHFFEAPINRLKRFFPYRASPAPRAPRPVPVAEAGAMNT